MRRAKALIVTGLIFVPAAFALPRYDVATQAKRAVIRSQLNEWTKVAIPPGTGLTQLSKNFYTYRWLGYRTAFLTTPEGVILFDPLNEDAAGHLVQEIAKVAPNPAIKYVIYSHHHRDHASGGRKIPGNPVFLAHANAAQKIRERNYPDVVPPTQTFDGEEFELQFGGETLRLIRLSDAHTDGLISIYLPRQKALYLVDIVVAHEAMTVAPSVGSSYNGVKAAVAKLLPLDFETLVPGHEDLGKRVDLVDYYLFLNDLDAAMVKALKRRGLENFHNQQAFEKYAVQLPDVFFEVEDELAPKYRHWRNFEQLMLPNMQWCFFGMLMGL